MRKIDGDALIIWLSDWWFSSFGYDEQTEESKAIKRVCDAVEEMVNELWERQEL